MPTIYDVAKRAGVSLKTVSRVLNDEPHVRDNLRERVLAAVKELDYRPSQAARRMAGSRSYLIAFPYNNPSPAYITGILSGAAIRCRESGYHLVVEPISLDDGLIGDVMRRLVHTLAPDAVFVTPPLSDNAEFLTVVGGLSTPIIRIAGVEEGPGINIVMDERVPAYEMTRHLIEIGHRRIGMIRPHPDHLSAASRYDGYVQAMTEAGLKIEPQYVVQGYFSFNSGQEAGRQLLQLEHPPTAIFATNDDMALGVMAVAHKLGLKPPEDLSIAGFDDIPATRTCWPSMTTIQQPLESLGAAAAEAGITGKLATDISLDYALILRESTRPPKR